MLKTSRHGPVLRYESSRNLPLWGSYWTIAYYVDGLLVDTGCAHTAAQLIEALSDKPLTRIVNTHSHEDHIGGNGPLQTHREGLEIFAHPLALPVLANPRETQPLHPYRRLFWGWPEPSSGKLLADGETVETENYTFQVLYTPGHSPDHLCLYEPEQGWLFSGDLYVGGYDRALRKESNIWEVIASLKLVAALPVETLFPGSARIREYPTEALAEKIAYLEELGERVMSLHQKGWPQKAIVREVCGGFMEVEAITLGHFSRPHLVSSYIDHYTGK
jgi:glyoxylase-like metal-dependent hydrolase (beta-lactamase superfamily II)